jgi:cyclohexanone monooxygenase
MRTPAQNAVPTQETLIHPDRDLDALVLGGGFGGMYMLHELRRRGFKVLAIEAGSDVGGAWYWNRYPGARCDVESLVYCYSFSPVIDAEWRWSERYAAQPEITRYMRFVCDRLDLRKDIRFNARLASATFDEGENRWTFRTASGDTYRARHFVSSAGPISAPIWPDIPGRETYSGELYHTALWPQAEPDFSGKRVGVIGNGSSGTQLIPLVAEQAAHLSVFVRTANFYVNARNRPLTEADYDWWEVNKERVRKGLRTNEYVGGGDVFITEAMNECRRHPASHYTPEEQRRIMQERWDFGGGSLPKAFADSLTNKAANDVVSVFLRGKVAETIRDPRTAEILTPRGFAFGTKRVCVGTNFLETFNRDNVEAIDAKATPIERFTATGLVVGGREIALDAIVCASGFDALTGALTVIDIRGVGGRSIKDAWATNSDTYLGFGVAGFPNLHMIGGPGSPSVLTNVVNTNEYQGDWIAGLMEHMRSTGRTRVEAEPAAQAAWSRTVKDAVADTVFKDADSWYVGTNVPGKAKGILAYAGGMMSYVAACDRVAANGYDGFRFSD